MHSGPPLGVPKERCRSVVCSEALLVLCKVCAVLNMGNVRTSSETATRKLRRSRRLHIQLPDHRQNEPQRNRRLGAASRSRRNSRTYRYRTAQRRTIRRRPKTPPEDSTACRGRRQATDARSARLAAALPQPRDRHHRRQEVGRARPSPAATRVSPKALPGSEATSPRTRTLTAAALCGTVSFTLWMSRYGPR